MKAIHMRAPTSISRIRPSIKIGVHIGWLCPALLMPASLVAAGWSLSNPAIHPEEVAADEPVETEPVDSPDEETRVADEDAAGALEGRGSTQLTTRVSQPASYGTDRGPRGLCQ